MVKWLRDVVVEDIKNSIALDFRVAEYKVGVHALKA